MLLKKKFLALLLCLLSLPLTSQSSKKTWNEQNRVAFLVGINEYDSLSSLKYAVKDAEQLGDLFLQVGGFSKVVRFTDKGIITYIYEPNSKSYSTSFQQAQPTKEIIEKTYIDLIKAKPELLVFYFSGNGIVSGDTSIENSIAPKNAKWNNGSIENGISLIELSNKTNRPEWKNTSLVYLVDASRTLLPKTDNKVINAEKLVPAANNKIDSMLGNENYYIPDEIKNSKGVIMLLGSSRSNFLEDDNLQNGVLSHFLIKGILGEVQNENFEEYTTTQSLKEYIEIQFNLYNEKEKKEIQLFQATNSRGVDGKFLITYSRPTHESLKIEKFLHSDPLENKSLYSKLIYKDKKRFLMNLFSWNNRIKRFLPDNWNGMSQIKYRFNKDQYGNENFYATQMDKDEKSIFEHKVEFVPEKGWEYKGIYQLTELDLKDEERKNIFFERKIFDFQGNVLLQEYFDKKGELLNINGVSTIIRKYDLLSHKVLEETYNSKGMLVSNNGYARYVAFYKSAGVLLLESWYDSDGSPAENEMGISIVKYVYDLDGKLNRILYLDKSSKPTQNITGVAKVHYTYNPFCLKAKQDRLLQAMNLERAQKTWKAKAYKVCAETIVYEDLESKPSQDAEKIHKKVYHFDTKGNKISEEFFRTDGRRWAKNGIARIFHQYDSEGNIVKTVFYGEYELNGKPIVPVSDEKGVHAYQYIYDSNSKDCLSVHKNLGIEYKDYDCAVKIVHYGIDEKPIVNLEGIEWIKVWYTGTNQEEALKEFYGKNDAYLGANQIGYCNLYDFRENHILSAYFDSSRNKVIMKDKKVFLYDNSSSISRLKESVKYELKNNKEAIVERKVYSYNDEGDLILGAKYKQKNSDELLVKKYISDYYDSSTGTKSGKVKQTSYYQMKNGKEVLIKRLAYDYKTQTNGLADGKLSEEVHYELRDGLEVLVKKLVYDYDSKGNLTKEVYYENIDSKEVPAKKMEYTYNEEGSVILYNYYEWLDGKETLLEKVVSDYFSSSSGSISGQLKQEVRFKIVEEKEILSERKVYTYNASKDLTNGKLKQIDFYILLEDKETLVKRYLYNYNSSLDGLSEGHINLEAYYQIVDGKELLIEKKVYDYNDKGNQIAYSYYESKNGKEALVYRYVYDNEVGESEKVYKSRLDKIAQMIKPNAELKESDKHTEKKDKTESLAKELKDKSKRRYYLKLLEDAYKDFKNQKKKYTIITEKLNEDSSFKVQEYKLVYANPKGNFERAIIQVNLDKLYRPVGIQFSNK